MNAVGALVPQWRALAAQMGPRGVFSSPEWIAAAVQWQSPDTRLRLVTIEDDARLVAVAPFALKTDTTLREPGRALRFVTVPDTQFADVVAAPGMEAAVARTLSGWLAASRGTWDRLQLDYLCDEGFALEHLQPALASTGIAATRQSFDVNLYIDLQGDWETFLSGRTRSLKKAINLAGNRLARAGAIEVTHTTSDASCRPGADEALALAIDVSSRSWKKPLGVSLDCDGPGRFIDRLSREARRADWLSLWLLRLDGRAVAMEYQLQSGGAVFALRSDFDESLNEVSPGSHLNRVMLERLFGSAAGGRYYMGPGTNAYKKRWTDASVQLYRLAGFSPTLRGRAAAVVEQKLLPLARRWRDRAKPVAPTTPEKEVA